LKKGEGRRVQVTKKGRKKSLTELDTLGKKLFGIPYLGFVGKGWIRKGGCDLVSPCWSSRKGVPEGGFRAVWR